MKKLTAVTVLVAVLVGLVGCTETEREDAVRPVVQDVIESLLAPMTAENSGQESVEPDSDREQ